jgi:hypothetical protein
MMTTSDVAARGRFGELVKLHAHGRRYLARDEERRLLEDGVTRYNLTLDEARSALRSAAAEEHLVLEGELDVAGEQLLRTLADPRGRVSRNDFRKAAAFYRARAGHAVTELESQRRLKRIMEEADLKPARSGRIIRTRRWYRQIPS